MKERKEEEEKEKEEKKRDRMVGLQVSFKLRIERGNIDR